MEEKGRGGGILRACLNVGVDCMNVGVDCVNPMSKGWRLLQTMRVDCMEP